MSASFIAIAFVAAVLIINWRLLLLVSVSALVALAVFGMGIIQPERPTVTDPGSTTSHGAPAGRSAAVVGQPVPR